MKGRKLRLLMLVIVGAILFVGCASKNEMEYGTSSNEIAPNYDVQYDTAENQEGKQEVLYSTSTASGNGSLINVNDKIIRRINMEIETKEFDDLIDTIDSQIGELGGYIESSSISGKRYYYSDNLRSGNIIARVPKDKLDYFVNVVSDIANVVLKNENTDNVTLQYSDIESHKKALEIEQERLLVLLDKAESVEDIIALETRLSNVRYELTNYESQLRIYDNQVEYSTITLSIQEVERMTATTEEEKSMWDRIKIGFSDSVYNISEGTKDLIVWLAVNFLYLLIWASFIVIAVLIIRRALGMNVKKPKQIGSVSNKKQEETEEEKKEEDQK